MNTLQAHAKDIGGNLNTNNPAIKTKRFRFVLAFTFFVISFKRKRGIHAPLQHPSFTRHRHWPHGHRRGHHRQRFGPEFAITLVTNSFSAGGGDGFPLSEFDTTALVDLDGNALGYDDVVANYIQNVLGGLITESQFGDAVTASRITVVPEPSGLAALALFGFAVLRRRR